MYLDAKQSLAYSEFEYQRWNTKEAKEWLEETKTRIDRIVNTVEV